jgi:hypothetical protein
MGLLFQQKMESFSWMLAIITTGKKEFGYQRFVKEFALMPVNKKRTDWISS